MATKASANDRQVGGQHYKAIGNIWDVLYDCGLDFLRGNALKYIGRHHLKNGDEDLRKAVHYLEKLAEKNWKPVAAVHLVGLHQYSLSLADDTTRKMFRAACWSPPAQAAKLIDKVRKRIYGSVE